MPPADAVQALLQLFDCVRQIVEYADAPEVIVELWRSLRAPTDAALRFAYSMPSAAERVGSPMRFCIRNCRSTFRPELPATCELIANHFSAAQLPILLYCASAIVKEHGGDPGYTPIVRKFVEQMLHVALSQLKSYEL